MAAPKGNKYFYGMLKERAMASFKMAQAASDIPLFMSIDELAEHSGKVGLCGNTVQSFDFPKEKDLVEYFMWNIKGFCKNYLRDPLVKAEEQYSVGVREFGPRERRVDVFARCKRKNYCIELKSPKWSRENLAAIGQLLNYGRKFCKDGESELLLITTLYDVETYETIQRFNLPIRYIFMDKSRTMEGKGFLQSQM